MATPQAEELEPQGKDLEPQNDELEPLMDADGRRSERMVRNREPQMDADAEEVPKCKSQMTNKLQNPMTEKP